MQKENGNGGKVIHFVLNHHFDKKMFLYICLFLSIWSEEFTESEVV